MVAVRPGFRRFAVSLQYHGSPFLGFAHQGDQENCILPDGTDLRGYVSVESRLRQALHSLLGSDEKYENIQVSSRTDRGVHAVKNTLHVDIRTDVTFLRPESIHRGLNFYLARPNEPYDHDDDDSSNYETSPVACKSSDGSSSSSRKRLRNATQYMRGGEWVRKNPMDEVRILAVKEAPRHMPNPLGPVYYNQEPMIDWNARFSATRRTYAYRTCTPSTIKTGWHPLNGIDPGGFTIRNRWMCRPCAKQRAVSWERTTLRPFEPSDASGMRPS